MAFKSDPGQCSCGNICNRLEKRGACPCLIRGAFCSDRCNCGTKKQTCVNRIGRQGSTLSEKLGIEQAPSDASDNWSTGEEAVVSMFILPCA